MFFAVNPWSDVMLAQLAEVLRTRSGPPPLHALVLLDGAFEPSLFDDRRWRRMPRHAVYAQGRLAELGQAGLWLLPLTEVAPTTTEALATLRSQLSGKPMFSLLLSAVAPDALVAHWRPFLHARTADGLDWPVRWGDSRVLPHLLSRMTPAEQDTLLAPLHAWTSVDRAGHLVQWPGAAQSAPAVWRDPVWELDDVRFGELVDAGEADGVISRIDDTRSDLLKHDTPVGTYQRVVHCLRLADQGGLQAAPDRQALVMIGLNLDARFMTHPAFVRLLKNTRAGASFSEEINALPDEFWDACERVNAVA